MSDTRERAEPEESVLAEIVVEVSERLRRGEEVDPFDYNTHAATLRELMPILQSMAGPQGASSPPRRPGSMGDFRIIREAGRGGMGIVYEAEQVSLGRRVALKVLLHAAALDPRQIQRFNLEVQTAAILDHPHIVPLFASGDIDGVPYYTMRFIDGTDLGRILQTLRDKEPQKTVSDLGKTIASAPLTMTGAAFHRAVARIAIQTAHALDYAHKSGILHRDIKPSNLMLDRSGKLWITDFGLARVSGDQDLTQTGDIIGTPRYMSPEQAMGKRSPLDGRADIYSLGATLYELLTLQPVFSGPDRLTVLRRIARDEPVPPRRIDPSIPVDLETIVLQAMAKSPSDRYATAADLADDLQRFLDNRPIRARRPSLMDWTLKWMLRHQDWAASLIVILVLIAVVAGYAGWHYNEILKAHNEALLAQINRADHNATESRFHAEEAERQKKVAETERGIADRHYFAAQLRLARQALDSRQFELAADLLDAVRPHPNTGRPSRFSWNYLNRLARREIVRLPDQGGKIVNLSVSENRKTMVATFRNDTLVVWDVGREEPRLTLREIRCEELSLSPDGRVVATKETLLNDPQSMTIRLWDTRTGKRIGEPPIPPAAWTGPIWFSLLGTGESLGVSWIDKDGKGGFRICPVSSDATLLSAKPVVEQPAWKWVFFAPGSDFFVTLEQGRLIVRDVRTGEILRQSVGSYADTRELVVSADRRTVGVILGENIAALINVDMKVEIDRRSFGSRISRIGLSPDGRTVAVVDAEGLVHLWDQRAGQSRLIKPDDLEGRYPLHSPVFSSDGKRLATTTVQQGGGPGRTSVWDVATGKLLRVLPSSDQYGTMLAFVNEDRDLIIGGLRSPRIWHLDPAPESPSLEGHKDEAWTVAYSPDGRFLASGADDSDEPMTIKIWNPKTGERIRGWQAGPGTVSTLVYSPDGRVLVSGLLSDHDNVSLWNPATGQRLQTISTYAHWVRSVAFSPEGDQIAIGGGKTMADTGSYVSQICDIATGKCVISLKGHTNVVSSLAFSPSGETLASVSRDQTLRLWERRTGRLLRTSQGSASLAAVGFAPDGLTLATVDEVGVITLHDANSLSVLRMIQNHGERLTSLAWARNGRSIATSDMSGTIRLWDPITGQELLTLSGHKSQVMGLAFAPEGNALASCGFDGAVKVWRGQGESNGDFPDP